MRRPEQRNHRPIEGRREMPRTTVRGDQHARTLDTGLGQTQRKRMIGQGANLGAVSRSRNLPGHLLLPRTAKNKHPSIAGLGQPARKLCEILSRPVFCRTKGRARIQAHDLGLPGKTGLLPDQVGRSLVF